MKSDKLLQAEKRIEQLEEKIWLLLMEIESMEAELRHERAKSHRAARERSWGL